MESGQKKASKVGKLEKDESLLVNIGSLSAGARVLAVKNDLAKIALTQPVCTEEGEKLALSRKVDKRWRCLPNSIFVLLRPSVPFVASLTEL